ncbi:MAG: hypothetical protein J5878_01600 [Oscillospiraceae bacterium]|nr:hypothetical protein [Oscillospiraceae bacterium]
MKTQILKWLFLTDVSAIVLFAWLAVAENNRPATGLAALSGTGRFAVYLIILGILVLLLVGLGLYALLRSER